MRAPPLAQEEPQQTYCQGLGQSPTAVPRLRLCLGLPLSGQQVRVHPLVWWMRLVTRQVMQSAPRLQQPLQLASGP
jgi:hypothetical protein